MKGSLVILAFFVVGIIVGLFAPDLLDYCSGVDLYVLMTLMFLVGVSVGSDSSVWQSIKTLDKRILLLPLCTIVGTLGASFVLSLFMRWQWNEVLAVASGFAYYSLSSVFITQLKGAELGTVALLANISREIITLLFAPLLAWAFGKLSPISSGGATTMDTTLPIIQQTCGQQFVVVAIYHGFVVDFTVPFLVTFFCTI